MNKLMILLMLLIPAKNTKMQWLICESSSLSVKGSTNVNTFSCDIPNCDQEDTLTVWRNEKGIQLTGSINPATLSFDCHKAMMTRDLRKTLKAEDYPRLHIRFMSLSELPEMSNNPIPIKGEVEIEIAGVKKQYTINYQLYVDPDKMIHLVGSRDLNFSDFKLIPPRTLGGLIKTKDQLTVAFHLKMKNL